MSSKEKLQSLNEELNALNSQLQETLRRQRTTADDLQNVLYSTDVATMLPRHNASISAFSRRRRKPCSTSFLVTWGGPHGPGKSLAPDSDLLPDARGFWRLSKPIEARSRRVRAARGSFGKYCRIGRETRRPRASSLPLRTSRREGARRTRYPRGKAAS